MATFVSRKGPNGRRVWQAHIRRREFPAQVRTFDTKAEAQAWAATIESEMARVGSGLPLHGPDPGQGRGRHYQEQRRRGCRTQDDRRASRAAPTPLQHRPQGVGMESLGNPTEHVRRPR